MSIDNDFGTTASYSYRWNPVIGEETNDFINHCVPETAREGIKKTAISILSKGIPPDIGKGVETGLVIGYVQSGKTMSFETVTALARDNGFQIVIVIAGTSNPLLSQSTNRLEKDLRLNDSNKSRRWVQLKKIDCDENNIQKINNILDIWRNESTPIIYKKTILITVLKNHVRLNNLAELLESVNLEGCAALIIDDEADQVSLNTEVSQGQESSTYRCIMRLRDALPNHTYLQYTATPQAPLLVSIIDSLSPNFVQVLEPGEMYVGGREFFEKNTKLVKVIPINEIPTRNTPLSEPPDSLLDSLRIFMVGVTIGIIQSNNTGNRSMLVHPSHLRSQHQEYYRWVRTIFEDWRNCLSLPDSDHDKIELLSDFEDTYKELESSVKGGLPPFSQLVKSFRFAFENTQVLEVNSRQGGKTPEVDWQHNYGWILVGGMAVDRGFTVEGLTVTYMPRGIGVGNADTIQQRARFFGYKRNYLGFCRVYLEQGSLNAFQYYVEHEEDIRNQLISYQDPSKSLNNWKRAFIMDLSLKPCRDSVLEVDYIRSKLSNKWVYPRVVTGERTAITKNYNNVENFKRKIDWSPDIGNDNRTENQKHLLSAGVYLQKVMDELLVDTKVFGKSDSQKNTMLLLLLKKLIENDVNITCDVYIMSPTAKRIRSIDANGEIPNLFQGAYPVESKSRGQIYPGDQYIKNDSVITIQIHQLDIQEDKSIIAKNVPVIAVWIPEKYTKSMIAQQV